MLSTIDRALIGAMRKLCDFQKGEPASVMLPPHAAQLPGLIFHLRRSPAVRLRSLLSDGVHASAGWLAFARPVCSGYARASPNALLAPRWQNTSWWSVDEFRTDPSGLSAYVPCVMA